MNQQVKTKKCKAKGCGNEFIPSYSTLQPYCSCQCAYDEKKRKDANKPPTPIKYIPQFSKNRSKESKIYAAKRIVFLTKEENQKCPVYPEQKTSQVHHMKGRIGSLYLDERFWLAVSADGHEWIEKNPNEAKEKGYSLNRLTLY